MPEKLRGVAYYRKSDDDDGESVEQQEWARPACLQENIPLVRECVDQSKVGWDTAKRVNFHKMLAFCQEEKRRGRPVDVIVCWKANRFSRSDSNETGHFIWEFRQAGTGRMLTSARWIDFARMEDRILFNIEQDASSHAKASEDTRDVVRGMARAAREGQHLGGPIPYGYRLGVDADGEKRLVLGPPEEVEVVRLIFRTYADTRAGLRQIGALLAAKGVLSPSGKRVWTQATLRA